MDRHWRYFLAIENEVQIISNYVEFHTENFGTYSIEIAKNIMTATQEVDVVAKKLCKLIDPNFQNGRIDNYCSLITTNIPTILTDKVKLEYFNLEFTPFHDWSVGSPPSWWTANNKIKHKRGTDFDKATLEYLLNAMCGLLLIIANTNLKEREKETGEPLGQHEAFRNLHSNSKLFKLQSNYYHAW